MEVNRAARSLFGTALKQIGDGLTATERASLFASCQQNAMGLWGQTQFAANSLTPLGAAGGAMPPAGGPYDPALDAPKATGPAISEVDEAA